VTPHEPSPPLLAEDPLVARLRNGEESAFAELLIAEGGRMLTTARRLVRNEADAQDAVQESFLSAFRSIREFRSGARLGTWLHRIVLNVCLMRLRSRRRRPEQSIDQLLPNFEHRGHLAHAPHRWTAPDSALEREETRALVRRSIDALPETYRTVLLLRDIEGVGADDAAELLGISLGNAKVRLHRARQALRALLDPHLRESNA
jgi:RNA polymerase sigma-70 factor (ECF subfamily)